MMMTISEVNQYLSEARAARHKLMMGQREVSIMHSIQGQNAVTYERTSLDDLERYIRYLEGLQRQLTHGGGRAFQVY